MYLYKNLEFAEADVHVYNDAETSTCKGIFFSTQDMRSDLSKWPEIVFLDGTYKLTNNDITFMVFLVEDGNGRGQIAGAALLSTEERDVLEWMLNAFKTTNEEACKKIKCFMTDKDLLERDVLKTVFPMVPTYICGFHSIKIFERVVKNPEMKLNSEDKIAVMDILRKLVFSSSKEEYDDLYLELNLTATPEFMTYFNNNWHNIREEWSMYSVLQNSLGNTSNNRLESLNGKMKQVLEKNSPLLITIKDFFLWYGSHKTGSLLRTAAQFLKKKNLQFDADDSEKKYMKTLTEFASTKVLKEIKLSKKIVCFNAD
ncbi:uncharacterized protein LOC123273352 [Cotesia glomerata]|uniref:uncharacterized protein LOC123273352 n=1 Tax=Cotesia glomerata TaxID=32391 RepID=UPI001D009081|nr:uncharacterized protein LOC123273352 [Cotesia glomerata]